MSHIIQFPQIQGGRKSLQFTVFSGFSDVFLDVMSDAGVSALLLAKLASTGKTILWVGDRQSFREGGDLYMASKVKWGFLHCKVPRALDVLQAMEDGLGSSGLGAVIGEIWGEPYEVSFTATKRLALRSEESGIPCVLIRHNARPNLSAARNRFSIASLPSAPNFDDPNAPGDPRWRVELFKSRHQIPGTWIVKHDRAANHLDFIPLATDRTVGAGISASKRTTSG
ncbi:ImuA family protein [Pontivivens insulae]|uniref:ImuA family protein n=1 Tax=Pontivivens insulae TaxID=1639689 RepID=UPI0013C2B4EC|nr:hypothetical protein [Pontivivens insulae]